MVSIEQLNKAIERIEEVKGYLEKYPELDKYDITFDLSKFFEVKDNIERFMPFEEGIEYLIERNKRDCYGRYPDNERYCGDLHLGLEILLDTYNSYLKVFGGAIRHEKMPLKPDDVYDIIYHWKVMKEDPKAYLKFDNEKVYIEIGGDEL